MDELRAMAERCIRGEETVYRFAEALAKVRGVPLVRVMFGETPNEMEARQSLKQAHYAAVSPRRLPGN